MADPSTQALSTTVRVWPLFGRTLLLWICGVFVIPLPWAATSFLRWFVGQIELPQQQRASFAGKAGDIWYAFILYMLCVYGLAAASLLAPDSEESALASLIINLVHLLVLPVTTLFVLIVTRWFFANLVWEGRSAPLQFTGGYWALLGWSILAPLSFITIIGWAWVYTAWGRWLCRNVKGSARQLVFTASGWSFLWRTIAYVLSALFVIPIPWTYRWYIRWLVSRFALTT